MIAIVCEDPDQLHKEEWVFFDPNWHFGKQQLTVSLHRHETFARPSLRHHYRSVNKIENNGGGFRHNNGLVNVPAPTIPAAVAAKVREMLTPVFWQEVESA